MATAPKISEFSSLIRNNNISRPYLFFVELTIPDGLYISGKQSTDDSKKLSLLCHAATTPMLEIMTADNYYEAGIKRKFIYDYDYQDLTLEFYVDQQYTVQRFFESWKNLIVNSRRNFSWPDDYTAENFNLHLIDLSDKANFSYSYRRVTPKNINSISLHHGAGGIMTLPVTFNFETVETSETTIKADPRLQEQVVKIKSSYTNPEVLQAINAQNLLDTFDV
jgi:hypothetical protein